MSEHEDPTLWSSQKLYNLSLSNRLTQEISTPILYLHHFGASEWAKEPDLYILIEHPRFEYMVNTFTIRLSSIKCNSQGGVDSSSSSPCSCLALDNTLGTALISLRSLKVLDILCDLHGVHRSDQHQYLIHLKTRVLQEVRLTCHYCIITEKEMIKILGSPCMESVISLDWDLSNIDSDDGNDFESFLKDTNTLSNLQELYHNGSTFDDLLLWYRPIRRLRASSHNTLGALLKGGDLQRENMPLTHLNFPRILMTSLIDVIKQDPNPLRNLRHIGTFCYFSNFGLTSLEDLGRCARLSKLVSFSASAQHTSFTDIEELLDKHSTQLLNWFPDLRKVFFRFMKGLSVWVRPSRGWECRGRDLKLLQAEFIRDWGILYEKCIADGCTENAAALIERFED
ncbi:hypothetical protein CPB86DRAFT_102309 [Serendipita vermifera]|nr:hypothetical protein CPB86DRAFT_102309 [Serendipita vermifera]